MTHNTSGPSQHRLEEVGRHYTELRPAAKSDDEACLAVAQQLGISVNTVRSYCVKLRVIQPSVARRTKEEREQAKREARAAARAAAAHVAPPSAAPHAPVSANGAAAELTTINQITQLYDTLSTEGRALVKRVLQ